MVLAAPWYARIALVCLTLLGLAGAVSVFQAREAGPWQRVAALNDLQSKGVLYIPEHPAFLVDHNGKALAIAGWSPHTPGRDERVLFCESSQMFVAFHGELFDRVGAYFGGPSPRGLDRFPVKVENNDVYINPDRLELGPPRQQPKPLEPAGPFCPEGAAEAAPGFLQFDS
ncbi:MAG: Rieske (2Fe-2S) protein [Actinomycetota bacterium]